VLNLEPLKAGLQESGIEQAEVKRSKWIACGHGCLPSSHAPIASFKGAEWLLQHLQNARTLVSNRQSVSSLSLHCRTKENIEDKKERAGGCNETSGRLP
jgi:hypothetical protein